MVGDHMVIALSYFLIPSALGKLKPLLTGHIGFLQLKGLLLLRLFIYLCGLGHLATAVTFFWPWYYTEWAIHTATAGVSVVAFLELRQEAQKQKWKQHLSKPS